MPLPRFAPNRPIRHCCHSCASFCVVHPLQKLGYPVIPLATYKTMQKALPSCVSQIAACQNDSSVCGSAVSNCNAALIEPCESGSRDAADASCRFSCLAFRVSWLLASRDDLSLR